MCNTDLRMCSQKKMFENMKQPVKVLFYPELGGNKTNYPVKQTSYPIPWELQPLLQTAVDFQVSGLF